ncbi:MAG: hypothetical protein HYR56_29800 [Acidobacteria bacterium]|nr:hypothetical protein [Acidobacteriota bacterium]MBI3421442.1 hypothetical protein [Acidobacteriota bacterium]
MGANNINFVTSLIYGDLGTAELGPPPGGTKNHLVWTFDNRPTSNVAGNAFLDHHLNVMLSRYEAWRSLYLLPPVRPWDGWDVFPDNDSLTLPVGPGVPAALNGSPFPGTWTTNDLGTAARNYYNTLRNYVSSGNGMELDDEIKAPFSYRYWAFMRWVLDLRKRLLGQPVFPVPPIYDRDGTILSEKDFTDIFHQVHHVWHPNSGAASWTVATPFFKTGVGQHRRKKQISRTQVGAEFFTFHRDHLVLFDRWLARTGQDAVQSLNTCAHDTPSNPPPPANLDVVWNAQGPGHPVVDWSNTPPTVDIAPVHTTFWNGDLGEFANAGEMGQFFARDFNPFILDTPATSSSGQMIPVAGASDSGYHGPGHYLNGDLAPPVTNNHVPRFFAWHGFIDDVWAKREPRFVTFAPVQADGSAYPSPQILTILREFSTSTDSVEPANAIQGINLTDGNGTLRVKINVRPDPTSFNPPFGRPLELMLQCEVLREAGGAAPVIALPPRNLIITTGAPINPNERQQGVNFIEDFVFDGSAGTVDVDTVPEGPFASDNLSFTPTATGFKNSLIRVTGHLTCKHKPDGSIPAAAGTVSSSGTTITGSGTSFQTFFRQGDLIRAAGQVRMIALIGSNTTLTLLDAFAAALPAGTTYERLDGFDHEEIIEIPLLQEKQAPEITVYLDRSSFSQDQVDAIALSGQSVFDNAFYVLVQDRTARAAPIVWPPEVEPQLQGLIAPPVRAAGLYTDNAHAPALELRDAITDVSLAGLVDVAAIGNGLPEDPSLHPSAPQRVTWSYRVTFSGNATFAGMNAGDFKDLKLVIKTRDRSGNEAMDDASRVRLQIDSNPYMLDGTTSWLSIDTRVLKVNQGVARFGVPAGWTDPNVFIQQAIDNLRDGTAGADNFDSLTPDQEQSVLEYSTQVSGVNVHNFALAKVRMQSVTGTDTSPTAPKVRASFRLLRWGTANVEFDNTLTYRTDAASGIALLGRTATNELASIPFFAEPRVATSAAMTTQTDPKNLTHFPPTGGGELPSFFGAYLDINQGAPRFPQTFTGDGGFGSGLFPIRDLLISQHQCMVVEVWYPPDPTVNGSTPGTSDNLSQRNLLILRTANPGSEITRAIQHSFDINLTRARRRQPNQQPTPQRAHAGHHEKEDELERPTPRPARPAVCCVGDKGNGHEHGGGHGFEHLRSSWLAQAPGVVEGLIKRSEAEASETARWQFDAERWKSTEGLDELVFFWNNLPRQSVVELYLPGANVEEIVNYRNLRHAPGSVGIRDSHTLRLFVAGPTYLPIPPFWGDNLAGLVTVTLPAGIKEGQKFIVDVNQVRTDQRRVLGGFQINIQVSKAARLHEPERRLLSLFHQRLNLTPKLSRWRPVLERQVEFLRQRARGFVELANDPNVKWEDPTEREQGQKVRLVLERIQILDDHDPFIKGAGEFRFHARVHSRNNGGLLRELRLPGKGHFSISDAPGHNTIHLNLPLFEDFVEDHLAVEIMGIELDTFDPDDELCPYRRIFTGPPESWLGSYGPGDEQIEPENLGDWKVWYRIERA